jgi:hypothetical protein
MPKVNRESPEHAQKIIDGFIADESAKHAILSFLSNAIIFANRLNPRNWNLNLDKNGGFVRLNVGQEYCIQISSRYVYILTLKEYIRKRLAETQLDLKFIGYDGEKDVVMSDLENVPDMLTKVPDSVVCSIEHQNLASALPYLGEANREFIAYAIQNTTLLPKMIRAHSTGFITYLSQYCKKWIPNPSYIFDEEESYYDLTNEREGKFGGGFGNPETNRKVEQAAIAYVTDDYKKNGWLVKSIEYEKRGFDLLCTKDEAQEHVEVKGVQGDFVSFIITNGEVKQAQTDKHFVLCVVISALTAPKLHKFTAKEFQEKFVLETVSYRASLKQG